LRIIDITVRNDAMAKSCVLVCGEVKDCILDERTFELVGAGKELASVLGVEIAAVLLGDKLDSLAEETSFFGVDKVYKLTNPLLQTFDPDIWVAALGSLCQQITPKILLMLHSAPWMDVGPRLAFRLDSVLTTDCIHLEIDRADGCLLRTKPIYGGSGLAVLKYEGSPKLVTVRRNVMKPSERGATKGQIVDVPVDIDPSILKVESVRIV
jgi:electron transfer flavoprotein alpha subunit